MSADLPLPLSEQNEDGRSPLRGSGHSDEPASGLAADAGSVPNAGDWHLDTLRLTPQEWAEARTEVGNTIICSTDGMVSDVLACVIGRNEQERQERAAFIVRACNSHYELLEAAETARNHLGAVHPAARSVSEQIALNALADAIAKARGQ